MADFGINEMLEMQRTLQERYKDKWEGISPEVGKSKLLWMIGEVGEVIDIVKKYGPEASNADNPEREHLIEELAKTAPVYYSIGNHEYHWSDENEMKKAFTDAGAIVVDLSFQDVSINNSDIRIGGYYGSYRVPHLKGLNAEQTAIEMKFFDEFEDTDRYKILLAHIPTAWVDWNYTDKYPVDLIFSGHYHGGVIRIPFIGGMFAPYVGWFPQNTEGVFSGKYGTCILSTGLSGKNRIPRINNDPQIVVTDIVPK